jgi:hypothetical protein
LAELVLQAPEFMADGGGGTDSSTGLVWRGFLYRLTKKKKRECTLRFALNADDASPTDVDEDLLRACIGRVGDDPRNAADDSAFSDQYVHENITDEVQAVTDRIAALDAVSRRIATQMARLQARLDTAWAGVGDAGGTGAGGAGGAGGTGAGDESDE